MRGRMLRKIGLAMVGTASVVLLASCLVSGKDKSKNYRITSFPANLHIYAPGDYILMQYLNPYLVNGSPQSPGNSITLSWEQSTPPVPFIGNSNAALLRFVFKQAAGSAVQYVTQDATGSVLLKAFEGVGVSQTGQKNGFWPDRDGVLQQPDQPDTVQVFWSPFDSSTLGTNFADKQQMDFHVMGECDSSACKSLADVNFTEHVVNNSGIEIISTPLGNFETYHLHYSGTMNARAMASTTPPHFDYRISCWTPGTAGTVTFSGDVWIYPPIGPVQIENFCASSTANSGYQTVKYSAQITGTNLPF